MKQTEMTASVPGLGKNPNRFFVYALWIEGEENPFYIGKGQDDRPYDHLNASSYNSRGGNRHKNNTIKKAHYGGKEINVFYLEWDLDEASAHTLETDWIAYYGRRDLGTGCLTNLTNGGEGVSGFVFPEEVLKRLSEVRKELWADPGRRSRQSATSKAVWYANPDLAANMSAVQKSLWSDPGYAEKMSKIRKELFSKPAHKALVSKRTREAMADPEVKKRMSEAHTTPDVIFISRVALRNPLFHYLGRSIRKGYMRLQCKVCHGEVEAQNGSVFRGDLPKAHAECARDAFDLENGTRVYSFGVSHRAVKRLHIEMPEVPFTFRFAQAGIVFFDLDGNELNRTRLPASYTSARIEAERRYQ